MPGKITRLRYQRLLKSLPEITVLRLEVPHRVEALLGCVRDLDEAGNRPDRLHHQRDLTRARLDFSRRLLAPGRRCALLYPACGGRPSSLASAAACAIALACPTPGRGTRFTTGR